MSGHTTCGPLERHASAAFSSFRFSMTSSASETLRFTDVNSERPDLEVLAGTARAVCDGLSGARTIADCLELLRAWNAVRSQVSTYDSLVGLRFRQATDDAERKAAHDDWDAASPGWTELDVMVKRALLEHPLRAELEREVGAQAFALWESEALAFDASIKADLARESELISQYTALTASAQLEFQGGEETLSTIVRHRQSADRDTRLGAEQVLWAWFSANGDELDRIFDDLVELRAGMAQKLGQPSFVEVGYKRMCRVDYDREDVDRFRAEVRDQVVPLCAELAKRQAKELGVDTLMAWDEPVMDVAGNPVPRGDRAWIVDQTAAAMEGMDPALGAFFQRINGGGFHDLDSRKGKAGGGFCTSFPTYGMPFVFANFNGTKGDIRVWMHELGHAFQNYQSRNQWPLDFHWPTSETAEIHSMSLEFLSWPHMEAFFGDDADRFRHTHLTDALFFLPYGCAVDHFQHEVYANPGATPAERHAIWQRMEQLYLPWRQWGELEYPAKGGRWQHQLHLYHYPFYYIDYVLAQTCALQFWSLAETDRPGAMRAYVELCGRGGSGPFQELVRSAGLTSPFQAGCLAGVVEAARATLLKA